MYIYICVCVCVCVHACVRMCVCKHASKHVYDIHAQKYVYVPVYNVR